MEEYNRFDFFGGIRIGMMKLPDGTRPTYGLKAEVDYEIRKNVFIGLRGAYDVYMDSTEEIIDSVKDTRLYVKLGYKF